MRKITRVFLGADMRCSHDELKKFARKHDVTSYKRGELLVFINNRKSMAKILSGGETVIHIKPYNRHIEVQALIHLPEFLGLGGRVAYTKALHKFMQTEFPTRKKRDAVQK